MRIDELDSFILLKVNVFVDSMHYLLLLYIIFVNLIKFVRVLDSFATM